MDHREKLSFADRAGEFSKLMQKYPSRRCVVVHGDTQRKVTLRKHKFLAPADMSVGQFLFVLRSHVKELRSNQALFIFTERNQLPPLQKTISALHDECGDRDGALYLRVGTENTFGGPM